MRSSIAGFAFSAICGAILLHLMNGPVLIVEVMLVYSIAVQSLSVAVPWRDIDGAAYRCFWWAASSGCRSASTS